MTEPRPLISVIIPAYNSERYIAKCITSVINQSYGNTEILLIDNNSQDATVKIATELFRKADKQCRIIANPVRGVSYSRNIGLREAKGKYVFFLDSDDYLVDYDALENAVMSAEGNSLDIVHFGFNRVTEDGKMILPYTRLYKYVKTVECGRKVLKDYIVGRAWFCTGNVVYKKSLLENNSLIFTEGAFAGEDQEFIVKCLFHAERVFSIRKIFTNYVIHESSLSKKGIELLAAVESFERVLMYLRSFSSVHDLQHIEELIIHHKIPYLILRAVYKAAKQNVQFDVVYEKLSRDRYIGYLQHAKFTGGSFYEISTALLSKFFVTFPKLTYHTMVTLSHRM